jgi:hypothetical protein
MRPFQILALSATTLLAACGTPQERAAYREDPVSAMATVYGAGCEKAGYPQGSEQWRECIVRSTTEDDLARYAQFYDRYMQWYPLR